MNQSGSQSNHLGVRLLAAFVLIFTLAFAPGVSLAAEKGDHKDRTELRIQDMHAKLNITAAQEEQWSKVAQTMRDDASAIDVLVQARMAHSKDMTALDDLKSYGEIADAHAEGIKKLTPVFAVLYDTMSDPQKLAADNLFRRGEHMSARHKQGRKASAKN
jgi:hypothetical protein